MNDASTIVLMPGGYHFSDTPARIQTLLGSCVAMTFWHPGKKIGCMCHFVLPKRRGHDDPDARYADEFMEILLREIKLRGTRQQEYQVRLYGAGNMFSTAYAACADFWQCNGVLCEGCQNVACRNRFAAFSETKKHGFTVVESDLGGTEYRHIEFHTADGKSLLKKTSRLDPEHFTRIAFG